MSDGAYDNTGMKEDKVSLGKEAKDKREKVACKGKEMQKRREMKAGGIRDRRNARKRECEKEGVREEGIREGIREGMR